MATFPRSVREKALVLSARHCCSCHKHGAVNVEVHHLVPPREGGSQDLDNAIVLCGECHAQAGHYNVKHPRGSKYSVTELRLARDTWYDIVASGTIKVDHTSPPPIYVRYLVDLDHVDEIGGREPALLPILGPTPVHGGEAARYTSTYRDQMRSVENTYANLEVYRALWAAQINEEMRGTDYPSYNAARSVTPEEFDVKVRPAAPQLTVLSKDHQVRIDDLVRALAHTPDPCGDSSGSQELSERYFTRSLWPLYLAVTNVSDEPVQLHELIGSGQEGSGFFPFRGSQVELAPKHIAVPRSPLEPKASVVIQIGNILGTFREAERLDLVKSDVEVDGVGYRTLALTSLKLDDALGYAGPLLLPRTVVASNTKGLQRITVHAFDPSLMYAIDTQWMIGCCPHLYARIGAQWEYVTSLFTKAPGSTVEERIILPLGTSEVIIAELEHEVSWLTSVTANGNCLVKDKTLRRGDSIHIPVNDDLTLDIVGGYTPPPISINSRLFRNSIIRSELARMRQGHQLR
ncbi:MAG: HNH endonuclease [Flavobacteriales bacterium]|nr:HNH endonuclease [Flavobacteriales bacterium]